MALTDDSDIAKAMGVDPGPSLHLNDKQYGSIDQLKVGEEIEWKVKGVVQSVDAHGATSYSKPHAHATINITEIDGKKATVAPKKRTGGGEIAAYDYDD